MRPKFVPVGPIFWNKAKSFVKPDWHGGIRVAPPSPVHPAVHVGTIASGEHVVNSAEVMDWLAKHFRDLKAVAMEGYGASAAVLDQHPRPDVVEIIREIERETGHSRNTNYCGLALSTSQSGTYRGAPRLSKRGNARPRCAFWMAAKAAIMQRQNGFRRKYDSYVRSNPIDPDLKRKAYTAVAAKVARVAFGLIKSGKEYRRFVEAAVPGGRIPSQGR